MSIKTNTLTKVFYSNGRDVVFIIETDYLRTSFVEIKVDNVLYIENVDYNVVFTQSSYRFILIVFRTPPAINKKIEIFLFNSIEQGINFDNSLPVVNPLSLEYGFDKLTLISQRLFDRLVELKKQLGEIDKIDLSPLIENRLIRVDSERNLVLTIPIQFPKSQQDAEKYFVVSSDTETINLQTINAGKEQYKLPNVPPYTDLNSHFLVGEKNGYKLWFNFVPPTGEDGDSSFVVDEFGQSILFKKSESHGVLPPVDTSDNEKIGIVDSDWNVSSYKTPENLQVSDIYSVLIAFSTEEIKLEKTPPDNISRAWLNNSVIAGCVVKKTSDITFNVSAGQCFFVSNEDGAPLTVSIVQTPAFVGVSVVDMSQDFSYLYMESSGTLSQSNSLDPSPRGTKILLAKIEHPSNLDIARIITESQIANNYPRQIRTVYDIEGDYAADIEISTIDGTKLSHKGVVYTGYNVNPQNNTQMPHTISLPSKTPISLVFVDTRQQISILVSEFPLVPKVELPNSGLSNLPVGKVGFYPVWLTPENTLIIQYSTKVYDTAEEENISDYLVRDLGNLFLESSSCLIGLIIWENGKTFLTGNEFIQLGGLKYTTHVPIPTGDVDDINEIYQVTEEGTPTLSMRFPSFGSSFDSSSEKNILIYDVEKSNGLVLGTVEEGLRLGGQGSAFVITNSVGDIQRFSTTSPAPSPHFRIIQDFSNSIVDQYGKNLGRVSLSFGLFTLKDYIGSAPRILLLSDWLNGFESFSYPVRNAEPFNVSIPRPTVYPDIFPKYIRTRNIPLVTPPYGKIKYSVKDPSNFGIDVASLISTSRQHCVTSSCPSVVLPNLNSQSGQIRFTNTNAGYQNTSTEIYYMTGFCFISINIEKLRSISSNAYLYVEPSGGTVSVSTYSFLLTPSKYQINATGPYFDESGTQQTPDPSYFSFAMSSNSPGTFSLGLSAAVPGTSVLPERLAESRFEHLTLSAIANLPASDDVVIGTQFSNITPGKILVVYHTPAIKKLKVTGKASLKPEYRGIAMNSLNLVEDNTYPQVFLEKDSPTPGNPPVDSYEATFVGGHTNNWGVCYLFENVTQDMFDNWKLVVYLRTKDPDAKTKAVNIETQITLLNV